ncbi:unnamed protein product [Peronospora belbahrii]|uniref:ENTH domain-containing protein n=1 Tax=Peronospora belbahrii TaxID=622444 RepID=A0AAU9LD73_9STRA|nr:unnamed protein product [Peronospora belbahrii]
MDRFALDKIKNVMDDAKSAVKAKMGTDVERKIEEALSNKNWGASSTLLNEISQLTYDFESYGVIMRKIWEAMDAEGRQWRSVYKALSLLEHLIKNGTERVIENARDHMFKLRHLSSFSYHDGSIDRGSGVRDKAKQLADMLNDNDMIRTEREKAGRLRNKYVGIGSGYSGGGNYSGGSGSSHSASYNGGGGSGNGGGRGSKEKESKQKEKGYSSRYADDDRDEESEDSESEEEVPSKRRTASSKRKAAVKKDEETESKPAVEAPPAEPNLLDTDFFNPAPVAANTFDPFAPAQAPTAVVSQTASFAAFENAVPAPQQSFDAFGTAQPMQQQASFDAFGNTAASAQGNVQPFAAFPTVPAQQGFDAFGQQGNAPAFPTPAFNQQQQHQFGQFGGMQGSVPQPVHGGMSMKGAAQNQSRTNAVPKVEEKKSNDAWGAGSSLFDLNNLRSSSSNNSSNAGHHGQHSHHQHLQQHSNAGRNSFSGLDTLAGLPTKPTMGGAGGINSVGGMGGMNYGGSGMGHGGMQQQHMYGQMGQGRMTMGGMQPRPTMGMAMGIQQPGIVMGMHPGMGGVMSQGGFSGMGAMQQQQQQRQQQAFNQFGNFS